MSKFNLFDESTWRSSVVVDIETSIANKALGAIGQKVHELRKLKETLITRPRYDQEDYAIARALKDNNSEAYNIMQIEITYSDVKVAEVIKDIDFIVDSWQDKAWRERNWKQLLPALKKLEPYLHRGTGLVDIVNLVKVDVKGNAAWNVYLESERSRKFLLTQHVTISCDEDNPLDIDIEDDRND